MANAPPRPAAHAHSLAVSSVLVPVRCRAPPPHPRLIRAPLPSPPTANQPCRLQLRALRDERFFDFRCSRAFPRARTRDAVASCRQSRCFSLPFTGSPLATIRYNNMRAIVRFVLQWVPPPDNRGRPRFPFGTAIPRPPRVPLFVGDWSKYIIIIIIFIIHIILSLTRVR